MEIRTVIEVSKKEYMRLFPLLTDDDNKPLKMGDLSELAFLEIKGIDGKITIGIGCDS